jgi:Putative Flp pilus-assembly TadE/G-like
VVAALAMVALLAFVGLVLNMGLFLVERRHLQNAADAMALAATWRVLDEQTSRVFLDSAVLAQAQRLAAQNNVILGPERGLTASYVDQAGVLLATVGGGTMPEAAAGVRVSLGGPFDTLLAGFVGRNTIQVSAQGEARLIPIAPPASLAAIVPLAVPLTAYLNAADTSYDLYSLPDPYLDMTAVANGGTAAPSYGDMHTNLQFWSDGSHAAGTLIIGSRVAFAGAGYASDVQTGLADNVRRQNLPNDPAYSGSGTPPYILITLPLCAPCSAPTPTIVGFARFNLASSNIGLTRLSGWFVPFVDDPSVIARQPGPLWGPSAVAMTR